MTVGRGIPPWRLGMTYIQRPGLVRSVRQPNRYGVGCLPSVTAATRIDYYRGLRAAWFPDDRGRLRLVDVATERAGDRSADGFVVDVSTRGQVERRHRGSAVRYGKGPPALGATSLTVFRRTGKEAFETFVYWFDARGVLTALETFTGGC